MKAKVNAEDCSACGLCADTCPEVFELPDGADVARVKSNPVPGDQEDGAREAADGCPTGAILLED